MKLKFFFFSLFFSFVLCYIFSPILCDILFWCWSNSIYHLSYRQLPYLITTTAKCTSWECSVHSEWETKSVCKKIICFLYQSFYGTILFFSCHLYSNTHPVGSKQKKLVFYFCLFHFIVHRHKQTRSIPRSKFEHEIIARFMQDMLYPACLWLLSSIQFSEVQLVRFKSNSVRMKWRKKNQCKNGHRAETRASNNKVFANTNYGSMFSTLFLCYVAHRVLKVANCRFYERITQYFFDIINIFAARLHTTSNLYIYCDWIDRFYPLHVSTREYKTHDNIYGKKVFYIAFFWRLNSLLAKWSTSPNDLVQQFHSSNFLQCIRNKKNNNNNIGVGSNSQNDGKRNKMA